MNPSLQGICDNVRHGVQTTISSDETREQKVSIRKLQSEIVDDELVGDKVGKFKLLESLHHQGPRFAGRLEPEKAEEVITEKQMHE